MLSQSEQKQLVNLLRKLDPGYYPIEIFWEFCRLNKLTSIEILPFVMRDGKPYKILLTNRGEKDRFWKNMYHYTGCVVRANDTLEDSIKRVLNDELSSVKLVSSPKFLFVNFSDNNPRGKSLGLIYYMEVEEYSKVGEFFDIDSLPENIVTEQINVIKKAVELVQTTLT